MGGLTKLKRIEDGISKGRYSAIVELTKKRENVDLAFPAVTKAGMKPSLIAVYDQPSWSLESNRARLCITQAGGHMAPLQFRLGNRTIEPLSVAPWHGEVLDKKLPNLIKVLRGDFFCAPFGGNDKSFRGEQHPLHGETANAKWRAHNMGENDGSAVLHLSMQVRTRPGHIDKYLEFRNGETNLYQRHVISGMKGPMCLGHHAMLKFPEQPGSGLISTSKILRAQVAPLLFEEPAKGGYSSLKTGARFKQLSKVPSASGTQADLSIFPQREGFEDLVMVIHEASKAFAWTAVVFPGQGYVWFSLKNPSTLRSTVLWHSNGGRHSAPWSGRHRHVLGIEDVTSYFHYGLYESARANPVNKEGYPTALKLSPTKPLSVPYIMGVAAIPSGFNHVKSIRPVQGGIRLTSRSGKHVETPVDLSFLE